MTAFCRTSAALIALLAASSLALYIHVGLVRNAHLSIGEELWRQARYFTILTNAIVAATFARIALTGRAAAPWVAGVTLWIVITGAVYHALLARDHSGLRGLADAGLHTAVPLAVLGWWLLLAPRAGLAWRHAAWWLIWPALYLSYALVRGGIDGRHPYFFVDPPQIGWPSVIVWCLALGAVFWAAGLMLVFLGRFVPQAVRGGAIQAVRRGAPRRSRRPPGAGPWPPRR